MSRAGPLQRIYARVHSALFAMRHIRQSACPARATNACIHCREGDKTAMRPFAKFLYNYTSIFTEIVSIIKIKTKLNYEL